MTICSLSSVQWRDEQELRETVKAWATKMGVQHPQVDIRLLKSKWGSISTKGRMTLNSQFLELPKEHGEFVIVHELVHILAPNHGFVLIW
jgi:predicted metal-dependent hydrolase